MNIRLLFLPILALIPITNYSMMDKIKYYANPYTYLCKYIDANYQDASPEIQEWGKRVQENVGIVNPHKVKIMSKKEKLKKFASAYAWSGFIFIDDEYFDNYPYEWGNHTLHHEAMHIYKRHSLRTIGTCTLFGCLLHYLGERFCKHMQLDPWSSTFLGFGAGYAMAFGLLLNRMAKTCESEADTEGAYATECHHCVDEAGRYHVDIAADYNDQGYASAKKMCGIAEELRSQNKICAYHKDRYGY